MGGFFMINPKVLGISAFVGFFMSFLIGLFAGIPFLNLLLRAVFCAVLFAALAAVVYFLFQKFLAETGSEPVAAAENRSEPVKTQKTGGVVDITVEDESLPENSDGPQFYVANNRPSFSSDIHPSSPAAAPVAGEKTEVTHKMVPAESASGESARAFVPLDFSAAQKVTADTEPVVEKTEEPVEMESEDLDELPDIADLSPSSGISDGIVRDSEFASSSGSGQKGRDLTGGGDGSGSDSTVMAQAIRTLLAKDKGN
jgi:hypothetical protein